MILIICWPGWTDWTTSSPKALPLMDSTKSLATLKCTSASSSAMRTSRRDSETLPSEIFPSPRRLRKTFCNLPLRESNMGLSVAQQHHRRKARRRRVTGGLNCPHRLRVLPGNGNPRWGRCSLGMAPRGWTYARRERTEGRGFRADARWGLRCCDPMLAAVQPRCRRYVAEGKPIGGFPFRGWPTGAREIPFPGRSSPRIPCIRKP